MQTTKIVVLGGGYGGVSAAKHLRKHFKKDTSIEITLIDVNPYHTLMTELHEIAGSRTEAEAVQISFKKIFSEHGVKVVSDEISAIDFENRKLKSASSEYDYDYLVLGTGGSPEFFGTPGVQESSYTLWSLEDAIRIRENVELRFRDAAKEPDEAKRQRELTFVIAGAGFTGIELAGELLDRAEILCPKYHIERSDVRILIVEAKDSVLPILPVPLREKATKYLEKRGAEILLNAPIVKAETGKVFLASGQILETETFIWTCGIQGSEFTARINLTKGKTSNDLCSVASPEGIHGMAGCHFDDDERYVVGERGRILVNEYLQSVDHRNVYLCGDMIWFLSDGKVVPQIVETALQSATCVASNIAADIEQKPRTGFAPKYHGFMVSIGAKYGVAHGMGLSMSGWPAIAAKHLINLHYLLEVAGFNACWAYIKEEFTQVRDRRSVTRGHASAKIPAYWALPLRLFLGFTWLSQAVHKISEGWLDFNKVYIPGVAQPAVKAVADATAAASEGYDAAAATASPVVAALATPSPAYDAAAAASDAVAATPAPDAVHQSAVAVHDGLSGLLHTVFDWAAGVLKWIDHISIPEKPWAIYTWIANNILGAAPYFFQTLIVCTELGIGLALIAGLFTFLASAASIGLACMFIISAFTGSNIYAYIAMALVLMGGAGQTLGLDHWVLPWLKKWWNGTKIAQKTYLYDGEPRTSSRTKKAK